MIHQEVPKLFCQQNLRGLVDKTTAQQATQGSAVRDRPPARTWIKKNFPLRFLDLLSHQEIPELKLFSQQELRDIVDKTTAQQPKVEKFEPNVPEEEATAETSGKQH